MTPVGHSMAGATIALLTVPLGMRLSRLFLAIVAFAILANVPDFRLPSWGHERYDISHSLFLNGLLAAVLALPFLISARAGRAVGGRMVAIGGVLAWLSHLLLDTFYNHGRGLQMFWPFSRARLALPIGWFETVRQPLPHFDAHSAKVWSIELVFYGVVVIAALMIRYAFRTWRGASGHPDQKHAQATHLDNP